MDMYIYQNACVTERERQRGIVLSMWWLRDGQEVFGPYPTQQEALRAAQALKELDTSGFFS